MGANDRQELITLLLIENNCCDNIELDDYIRKHYDVDKINERDKELLDEFLNKYALNNTGKSVTNL